MNTTHKSYWKENTLFGLLIGGSFSMASLLFIWGGKSVAMNPQLNNVIMLLTIFGVFVGAKKYRDEALGGIISYGKALGAGLYLLLIASAVYAIYTYALYASSDELFSTYKANMLETLKLVYEGTPIYNTLLETFNMFLLPVSIAMGEFFNHIVTGGIFTVLLAWFVKRKPQDFQQQV